jgi:hypothetical protein
MARGKMSCWRERAGDSEVYVGEVLRGEVV